MKLYQIYQAKDSIEKIENSQNLAGKRAYQLLDSIDMFKEEIKRIENEKNKLVRKYGKEENGQIKIEPNSENYESFVKEFSELLDQKKEIKIEEKLNEDDLDKIDLTISDIRNLKNINLFEEKKNEENT